MLRRVSRTLDCTSQYPSDVTSPKTRKHAGGGGGLHGHMAGRILGQQIIKNGVGDLIADLVRVAFGHGFGGNKPMFFCHIIPFFRTYRPAGCEAQ